MSLRHAILGILDFRPMHGYALKRVLEEGIATFWPVNLAAIYPSLRKLEDGGLVTHRTEPTQEGRPDRKVYEVTEAGRAELARWRNLPPDSDATFRNPLYLKLLFAQREDLPAARDWVSKAIERTSALANALRADLANPNTISTFFVRFMRESGIAHAELQAELLADLRDRLDGLLAEGKRDSRDPKV
jgi:DNA-binding PadR family transcriptional regulator